MKCNYNLIYKGVPVGYGQHKVQKGHEALAQGHGGNNKGLPNLEEESQHGYRMKNESN